MAVTTNPMNFHQTIQTDFLIIGSGIAGLMSAIVLGKQGTVLMVTKDKWMESSSGFAQGGIAVAFGEDDSTEDHIEDTLAAGAGFCNREAVQILVDEGPSRVKDLILWGARFDQEDGKFILGREGAHGRRRILHSRDSTGEEIVRTLFRKVEEFPTITRLPEYFSVDLLRDEQRCLGALLLDSRSKVLVPVFSRATLLASGGAGQIYVRTTNPPGATGDGMAMAYRAGAVLEDMEFVQFHPTTLALPGAPSFLITEALRGEGGMLRNRHGERFMSRYHSMEELAPRDVLSRAILREMEQTGTDHVLLDATHLKPDFIRERFPTIHNACLRFGIDVTRQAIPVSPGAHFFIGGVKTDLGCRSSLPGLYAAGEVACTGVHGANRLASNSLLEGLVFGARAGLSSGEYAAKTLPTQKGSSAFSSETPMRFLPDALSQKEELRRIMWEKAGIIRSRASLKEAASLLERWASRESAPVLSRGELEFRNLLAVSRMVVQGALLREESIGVHYREDFQERRRGAIHYPQKKGV